MSVPNFYQYSAAVICSAGLLISAVAQDKQHLELDSPFASYVESDFPFFTHTLDATSFGEQADPNNLVPRAIIFPLGQGYQAAFDPDLLRWALIWKANEDEEYMRMNSMSSGSYRLPNLKAPPGQKSLPHPLGDPLSAAPLSPGVWAGEAPEESDPRTRGSADPAEIGLGPIAPEVARFSGIRLEGEGAVLEYEAGGAQVREKIELRLGNSGDVILQRTLEIKGEPVKPLWIRRLDSPRQSGTEGWISVKSAQSLRQDYRVAQEGDKYVLKTQGEQVLEKNLEREPAPARWKQAVTVTNGVAADESQVLVYDQLGVPVTNPWKRNVRLSGIDFFPDGRAVFCTFDGDVWIVDNVQAGSEGSQWKRFASGLHEPQSIAVRDNEILVFDRNGIVRLHDTDQNGEADWYENFSNIFSQSAETREYAMDMQVAKDGSFYIAKGGQIGTRVGKLSGTILHVAADGRSYKVHSTGMRQPYLGYDALTDTLTASDQQGNWKPATPVYRLRGGGYYGFQPEPFKDKVTHPAPIDDPEIWIPHFVSPSAAGMVWTRGKGEAGPALAPFNDSMFLISYNRPELIKVFLSEDSKQAAAATVLTGFPCGLLKGSMNPADGALYVCGFEIFGSSGKEITGLYRVRSTGKPSWIPAKVSAHDKGILLGFEQSVDETLAADLGRYSVDLWNYKQTYQYGSGNYKLDGTPGQESVPVASVKVSQDKKSIFLAIPNLQETHSLRVTFRPPHPEVTHVESVYLTAWSFRETDLVQQGFADNEIDLVVKQGALEAMKVEPSVELGKTVATQYGCIACHATSAQSPDASALVAAGSAAATQVVVGPSWVGLWGSKRDFADGSFLQKVDETYLRESILDPARKVTAGFEMGKTGVGMPSYLGVLKDHELDSIILYIQSLQKVK